LGYSTLILNETFTSAFIPTTLEGAAAAPRMNAPGSSTSLETVFMSYSWRGEEEERRRRGEGYHLAHRYKWSITR